MSFLSDLGSAIAAEITKIKPELAAVYQFFKPLVIASVEEVGQAALNAVVAQAPLVISGQEKFNAAVSNVKATLASSGKTAELTLVSTAVQEAHDQIAALAHPAT